MDSTRARDMDALLARGAQVGPVAERILAGALPPPRRRWLPWALPTFAAAAVAVVLVARQADRPDGFAARGVAGAATVAVACVGGRMDACPPGARLLFTVEDLPERGHLAGYAQSATGERIWYFSSEGETPVVDAGPDRQPAGREVVLGREHPPGPYVVHLFVTRAPASRAQLLAGGGPGVLARARVPLTVGAPPRGEAIADPP